MFFVLSKVLWFFVKPLNLFLLMLAAGVVLLVAGRRRAGTGLVAVTLLLFVLAEFTTASQAALRVLENRFPVVAPDAVEPDGIIVLGGALGQGAVAAARRQVTLGERAEVMTTAVDLMRRHPQARLAFAGHSGALVHSGWDEAEMAERLFTALGVPRERMVFENRSRNTWQNGANLKALVNPQPEETWLLVTAAHHMPRSVGVFRQVGWEVVPFPVDFATLPEDDDLLRLGGGLGDLDVALHEAIGLLAYWLTDRSASLFPAPARTPTPSAAQ